jgi:nucleoside-diphosphate-sugar epimerase
MSDIVVVTGGAGFIGSFLCEALLREEKKVLCIDNFSTGSVQNIDPLLRHPNFQFLKLNLNKSFNLQDHSELTPWQIEHRGISEVYHFAAPTSIKHFKEHTKDTLLAHSVGTYHVLEMAKKYGARFLLASSSVVYGNRSDEKVTFKEDEMGIVDHLTPRASYDEGKRFAETMAYTYQETDGLEVRIARIFRTYGPRMPLKDGHQIPDFVLAALNNEPVHVNGHAEFRTSLVYVSDVVDAVIRLMRHSEAIGPVNIGSDLDLKLEDVAQKVIDMTASSSEIERKDQYDFLTEVVLPDITRAKSDLGWVPLMRLEDGLQKTIDYIRANKILLSAGNDLT